MLAIGFCSGVGLNGSASFESSSARIKAGF